MIQRDRTLDYRGLICPLPIAKLSEEIRNVEPGTVLEVIADDCAFEFDMRVWSQHSDCEIIYVAKERDGVHMFIKVL